MPKLRVLPALASVLLVTVGIAACSSSPGNDTGENALEAYLQAALDGDAEGVFALEAVDGRDSNNASIPCEGSDKLTQEHCQKTSAGLVERVSADNELSELLSKVRAEDVTLYGAHDDWGHHEAEVEELGLTAVLLETEGNWYVRRLSFPEAG